MSEVPSLVSPRLLLRPFMQSDAATVQRLAGDRRVADTTLTIPHPYPDGAAEAWIATHEAAWIMGRGMTLAVTRRAGGELIGAIGLSITPEHQSAEIGYWIGAPYWGSGYCTEAARALVEFGFVQLELHRIHARHFARNVASGRVMEKIGMQLEGLCRDAVRKWGRFEDLRLYGFLRSDWERSRQRV